MRETCRLMRLFLAAVMVAGCSDEAATDDSGDEYSDCAIGQSLCVDFCVNLQSDPLTP